MQINADTIHPQGWSLVISFPEKTLRSAWGGFEEWNELIRGSIVWAGLADPYETRSDLIQTHGGGTLEWLGWLMNAWSFQSPMKMPEVIQAVRNDEGNRYFALRDFLDCRPDACPDAEHLGKLLRTAKGRLVDGRRFTHDGKATPSLLPTRRDQAQSSLPGRPRMTRSRA